MQKKYKNISPAQAQQLGAKQVDGEETSVDVYFTIRPHQAVIVAAHRPETVGDTSLARENLIVGCALMHNRNQKLTIWEASALDHKRPAVAVSVVPKPLTQWYLKVPMYKGFQLRAYALATPVAGYAPELHQLLLAPREDDTPGYYLTDAEAYSSFSLVNGDDFAQEYPEVNRVAWAALRSLRCEHLLAGGIPELSRGWKGTTDMHKRA